MVDRIGEWIKDPDPGWRSWLIQTVADDGLVQFAPHLNDIIENDPDEFCRDMAIHAAGSPRAVECLPVLLRLAEGNNSNLTWRLATALSSYATEECGPHLANSFNDTSLDSSTRVFAAWGLSKLGNKKAIGYLIGMLDDPDESGGSFFSPGESLHAAQALCDVFGWSFSWNKSYVVKTKDRVKKMQSEA